VIELGYGARPLSLTLPPGLEAEVLPAPAPPPLADLRGALAGALARPIGCRPLGERVTARTCAVVIVSDASRDEPRAELFEAVREALGALPDDQITLAVANGTHQPGPVERLGLPDAVLRRHRVVNHDSRDQAQLVEVGRTAHGTRLRVNRCLVEADLIVTTGRIKPHYFAGYGGGTKGIFPGLGAEADIRQNHLLKADPASSLGRADGNPCRDDLEDAARRLGRDTFMLNVVEAGGTITGAVAGDLVLAHREGVRQLRPWVEVRAAPAPLVVVSAPLPVSGSLYQASKLVVPAGLLLQDGGVVIVAAECPEGTGPLQTVNQAIFTLGVRRFLPERYTLLLVSGLDQATVEQTYARHAPSLAWAVAEAARLIGGRGRVLVMPDAGDLVPIPSPTGG
jgi:nickel-dependent lactate racemase